MSKFTVLFAVLVLLTGCAAGPRTVDLSESFNKTNPLRIEERKRISAYKILHKPESSSAQSSGVFSTSYNGIGTAIKTKETVEEDLKNFIDKSFEVDVTSDRVLIITLLKADSYWVLDTLEKLPFIGLLTVAADREFGLNLRVRFEIEQSGKVVNSYVVDEKITVKGSAATDAAMKDTYKKLISEYRSTFFPDLEKNFVLRYF
jgi:hypothetical protein